VLVVGGGDGGVMREVLKHPTIEKAMLCEIDREVIETALKYYPEIPGNSFDDERAVVVIADGRKFVAETDERFDAIIIDSSEPIGPSAVLHTPEFFASCKRALTSDGILVTQNGLPFLYPDHLRDTTRSFAALFNHVAPYLCTQPCYFGGPFALNWASDEDDHLDITVKKLTKRQEKRGIVTRYWTPKLHNASFALPRYAQTLVDQAIVDGRSDRAAKSGYGRDQLAASKTPRT